MSAHPRRLLIVEQQKCVRKELAAVARRLGYDVATASNRVSFQQKLDGLSPSIVLLDLDMPGADTTLALKALKDSGSQAKLIFLCGDDDRQVSVAKGISDVLHLDVAGVLKKPVFIDTLRSSLIDVRTDVSDLRIKELSSAINKGEFRPAYQAKAVRQLDGSWRMSEVEALARWYRPNSKKEYPGQFVHLIEAAGLQPQFTFNLLKQIAQQLNDWDSRGLSITAAINIPQSLLGDQTFPDDLENMMRHHMLENSRLTLEVTEAVAMRESGPVAENLSVLQAKGFGLSIDSFGSGYLSIAKLHRLPFNEIKIDRFLVREIGFSDGAETVVEAMIMLGQNLDMTVCAEGVESPAMLDLLLDAGCDKIQGYYLGRASNAAVLESRVRKFEKAGFALDSIASDATDDTSTKILPIVRL